MCLHLRPMCITCSSLRVGSASKAPKLQGGKQVRSGSMPADQLVDLICRETSERYQARAAELRADRDHDGGCGAAMDDARLVRRRLGRKFQLLWKIAVEHSLVFPLTNAFGNALGKRCVLEGSCQKEGLT
jgi:hypothetical protein